LGDKVNQQLEVITPPLQRQSERDGAVKPAEEMPMGKTDSSFSIFEEGL